MKTYIEIEFTAGLEGFGYQEIENGDVLRLTDLNGNTLNLPEDGYGYIIADAHCARPTWAN